jgi:phosphoribulokinase
MRRQRPIILGIVGSLVRPDYVQPLEFVIVEGLLGFYTASMRQFYDIKVYLNPPEDLRRIWKIRRDTSKRGYTPEEVIAELEKREPDSRDFIRPQRQYADIVVHFHPSAGVAPEDAGSSLNAQLTLRPTIPHPDLSYLIDSQHSSRSGVRLELGRSDGKPADFLKIGGDVTPEHAAALEQAIWQHMPDLPPLSADQFGDYSDRAETRHSDPLALTQLLLTYHLLRKYSDVQMLPFAPPVAALSRLQPAAVLA